MNIENKDINNNAEEDLKEENLVIDETQSNLKNLSINILQTNEDIKLKKTIEQNTEKERNHKINESKKIAENSKTPKRYTEMINQIVMSQKQNIVTIINKDIFDWIKKQTERCIEGKKYLTLTTDILKKMTEQLNIIEKATLKTVLKSAPKEMSKMYLMMAYIETYLGIVEIARKSYEKSAKTVYGEAFQDFHTLAWVTEKDIKNEYEKRAKTI